MEVRDPQFLQRTHQLVLGIPVLHTERVLPHVNQFPDLVLHEDGEELVDVPALIPDGHDTGLVPVIGLQLLDLGEDGHLGILPVHVIDEVLFTESSELVDDGGYPALNDRGQAWETPARQNAHHPRSA